MTSPTVSQHLRAAQVLLNKVNRLLDTSLALAEAIGLAPFRIAGIQAAIMDNRHAWRDLNEVATALELTHAGHKL